MGQTLVLVGGIDTNLSIAAPTIPGFQLRAASLQLQTPEAFQPGPGGITIGTSGASIWRWPSTAGEVTSFAGSSQIIAGNNSTVSRILIPQGSSIYGGAVSVAPSAGPLSGNYSVLFTVGSNPVLSINGRQDYLPLVPIPSAVTASTITSLGAAPEPNGSTMIAAGTEDGSLRFFDFAPDEGLVYSGTFPLGYSSPVTQTLASSLPYSAYSVSLISASGPLLFVLNQTRTGVWVEETIKVAQDLTTAPAVTGLDIARFSNGFPALIAGTADGTLEVSNYTGTGAAGGWGSILAPLFNFGKSCSVPVSTFQEANGDNLLAAGCGSNIDVFSLSGANFTHVASLVLPPGVDARSMSFNDSGTLLIVGSSTGAVFDSGWPWKSWNQAQGLPLSNSGVVGILALPQSGGTTRAVFETSDGALYEVTDVSDGSRPVGLGSAGSSVAPGTIRLASVFGYSGGDLLVASGLQIEGARSTARFQGTVLGASWSSALSNSLVGSAPVFDAFGNKLVPVPITLTVQGGSGLVSNPMVEYNDTWSTNLSAQEFPGTMPLPSPNLRALNLSILALQGGLLHISVLFDYGGSPPPSGAPAVLLAVEAQLSRFGPYVVGIAGVAGGALLAVGKLRYGHGPRGRSRALQR
ncbi:MAG: hypothetical protein KGJ23_12345 [Euryarchaeota archaeon]|nr:hypothetical protein [Euryarchaeota archaeon]